VYFVVRKFCLSRLQRDSRFFLTLAFVMQRKIVTRCIMHAEITPVTKTELSRFFTEGC